KGGTGAEPEEALVTPGDIIPEWWARSSRNGGRHQIGTVGEIIPEWWATSSGISRPRDETKRVLSNGRGANAGRLGVQTAGRSSDQAARLSGTDRLDRRCDRRQALSPATRPAFVAGTKASSSMRVGTGRRLPTTGPRSTELRRSMTAYG